MIDYPVFEINAELSHSAQDRYNVTFQIKSGHNLRAAGKRGVGIFLRNGPYKRRCAYLMLSRLNVGAGDGCLRLQ